MVGLDQVAGLAYVDVEGNLVVPEARVAFLAVCSIQGVAEHLLDHPEARRDVQEGPVEVLDQVDQVGHHEIACLVADAGQDQVRADLVEVPDHQDRWDLWAVQVDRWV